MATGKDNKNNSSENNKADNLDAPQNTKLSADEKTANAKAELEKLEQELAEKANAEKQAKSNTSSKSDSTKKDNARQQSKPVTANQQKAATANQRPQNPGAKKSFSWLALFAFLFSLIAIGGVAYLGYLSQSFLATQKASLKHNEQLAENAKRVTEQTLSQVRSDVAQLHTNQSATYNLIQDTERSLKTLSNRVKEFGQSQPNTWLAAESLYLVNLAEHRLIIEKDSATAIQLLLAANVRLAAMQDPSVFYLRTAISEDIAMLNAIVQPETEAAYLALSGLISQVEKLPFAHKYTPEAVTQVSEPEVTENLDDWRSNLMASLKRFTGNFITITRRDTPVEPELPPKQRWYVRANVISQLIAAQDASLKNNQAIFDKSVEQAQTWLSQYFDLLDPAVVSAVNTLNAVKDKRVAINLPEGLSSQPLLKNYVRGQLELQQGSAVTPAEENNNE